MKLDGAYAAHIFRHPDVKLTFAQLELRKRVLKQVENEPEAFDMNYWEWMEDEEELRRLQEAGQPCGTTRCLAGWALFESGGKVPTGYHPFVSRPNAEIDGIRVLGLTEDEYYGSEDDGWYAEDRCDGLFYYSEEDAVDRLRELCDKPENPPWEESNGN